MDTQNLSELVVRWQEARRQGRDLSPGELCADCPELLAELERQLQALESMQAFLSGRSSDSGCSAETVGTAALPSVPGYEVRRVLGRGGMGVVYEARQLRLGRAVALKMVLAGADACPAERVRFRTEAEALARLQHPHVVQVFDVGEHAGQPFLALEYVEGGSLADRLAVAPPEPRAAARLVEALARGVQAIHEKGVLHRDLKPGNVLLADDGTPKVADFGLAKRLDAADGLSRTGDALGTPSYMAPEQAAGRTAEAGPAADVYSLGAILYECLTGRPPFRGLSRAAIVLQVLQDEAPPPRWLNARTPRDLESICLKCLEKDPRHRYATAAALADDLGRFLHGQPTHARPLGPGRRAVKWTRRRPTAAALIAVSTLAALGALLGVGWYTVQLEQHNTQLEGLNTALRDTARREQSERLRAEEQTTLARRQLYVTQIRSAVHARENGRTLQMVEWLQDCPPDERGIAWHELWRQGRREVRVLAPDEAQCNQVMYTPDGRTLAVSGFHGTVELWDPAAERRRAALRGHEDCVILAMAPDGRTLASGGNSDGRLILWDVATGRELGRLPHQPGGVWALAFSPDGQKLAVGGRDQPVRLWDWVAGRVCLSLPARPIETHCVAFSPSGTILAVSYDEQLVRLYDAATGQEWRQLAVQDRFARPLAWSPEGTILAAGGRDGTAQLWDVTSGRERGTLRVDERRTGGVTMGMAFAPDGRTLVTAGGDNVVKVWDVATGRERFALPQMRGMWSVAYRPDGRWLAFTTGGNVVLYALAPEPATSGLLGHTKSARGVAFSPDGRLLASASDDQTVTLWDRATGRQCRALPHDSPIYAVAFSPDGRTLASGGRAGTVALWDVAAGQVRATLTGHTDWVWRVAFAPDGRTLASAGRDETVRLWDAETGAARAVLEGHPDQVRSLTFTSDGRTLISGGKAAGGKYHHLALLLWDPVTGQRLRSLPAITEGFSLAASPDGRTLAQGNHSGLVCLWDLTTDRFLRLDGPPGYVHGAAFTPDRRTLATSHGSVLVLWDVATRQELLRLPGHTDMIHDLAIAPDGRTLATVGLDGAVRLWGDVGEQGVTLR
jgi:WD40 repeat protein/predicted Ser/Thr protein kinase